jgi:ankyrin repeat protein
VGESKQPGQNALSVAASSGHLELVKYLLSQGVPVVYGEKREKESALHQACNGSFDVTHDRDVARAGNAPVIDLLVDKVGDVNLRVPGRFEYMSPLEVAAQRAAAKTVKHLLETYPEIVIDPENVHGPRALHFAAYPPGTSKSPGGVRQDIPERVEIIRLLLAHGAKKDAVNNQDETPLEMAKKVGQDPRIIEALGGR